MENFTTSSTTKNSTNILKCVPRNRANNQSWWHRCLCLFLYNVKVIFHERYISHSQNIAWSINRSTEKKTIFNVLDLLNHHWDFVSEFISSSFVVKREWYFGEREEKNVSLFEIDNKCETSKVDAGKKHSHLSWFCGDNTQFIAWARMRDRN